MKKYRVIYTNHKPCLIEVNPYERDPAPEFGSTQWSRFESRSKRQALPLLNPIEGKDIYTNEDFDIVEAYEKEGEITFDVERPFYARNMGIKIIDAAYIIQTDI